MPLCFFSFSFSPFSFFPYSCFTLLRSRQPFGVPALFVVLQWGTPASELHLPSFLSFSSSSFSGKVLQPASSTFLPSFLLLCCASRFSSVTWPIVRAILFKLSGEILTVLRPASSSLQCFRCFPSTNLAQHSSYRRAVLFKRQMLLPPSSNLDLSCHHWSVVSAVESRSLPSKCCLCHQWCRE